jgi:hypothetical protein
MSTQTQVTPFFSPTQIPGCQLWFDAADPNGNGTLLQNGSGITTWNDKSSNRYSVSQTTASNRPIFTTGAQNGLPGLQFQTNTTLSNLSVNMPNFTTGSSSSVFFVTRNASTNSGWNIVNTVWFNAAGLDSTAYRRYHFSFNQNSTAGPTLYVNNGATFAFVGQDTGNAVSPSANAIIGFTISSSNATINTNGNSVNFAGFALQSITDNQGLFLFGDNRNNSSVASNIMMFEMIGYNSQLTVTQRQQVEGYLAWKWGLQGNLPANHPYKRSIIPPLLNPPTITPSSTQNTASTFSPRQITGCQLWLDGTDINGNGTQLANNATVSTWRDKSGLGYDFTASVAATYSSSAQAVVFNNSYYTSSYPANPTNETSFLVFMITTTNKPQIIVGANAGGRELALNNDGVQFGLLNSQTGWGAIVGTIVINNAFLATGQVSGGINTSISLNGSLTLTGPLSGTAFTSGVTTGLGREAGNSLPFYGNLYELVIFNSVLPVAQRQQMEGYLAWKWNLQSRLPRAHPFRSFPPFIPSIAFPARSVATFSIWQPTQISGCQLWLDAADSTSMTVSGSTVSQWNDKSGNGYNVTQSDAGSRPRFSQRQITFASDAYFDVPQASMNNATRYSIFFVFYPIASVNWILVKQYNGVGSYNMISMTNYWQNNTGITNYLYWNVWANPGYITNSGSALSQNTLQLIEIVYDSATVSIYRNGTILSSLVSANFAIPNQTNATNFTMGSWRADGGIQNSGVTNFSMAEFTYYNTNVSNEQRQQIEGYLAWKWGIQGSLPGNHPWKRWPPPP